MLQVGLSHVSIEETPTVLAPGFVSGRSVSNTFWPTDVVNKQAGLAQLLSLVGGKEESEKKEEKYQLRKSLSSLLIIPDISKKIYTICLKNTNAELL